MKLLFDEHFSFRTVLNLRDVFNEAAHVSGKELLTSSDCDIWLFAKREGYTIITKDDDFHQRSLTHGHPPKVIWLKVGNIRRDVVENFLRQKHPQIESFLANENASLFVLQ